MKGRTTKGIARQTFICIRSERGRTYQLEIYEVKGSDVKHVASTGKRYYGGHKGETSEALTALMEAKAIRPAILKRCGFDPKQPHRGYYQWPLRDQGLTIRILN